MLYDQWKRIATARRSEWALRDVASARTWTFGELWDLGERKTNPEGDIVYPNGHTIEFFLTLLAAWKAGQVACPLEAGQVPPAVIKPPTPCVHLKCTSGTTSAPRLIAFTGEQLAADAAQIVEAMGLRPEWPNLGVISLAHSYGFSNLVLPLLLHGIPLILVPAPLPELILRAASSETSITLPAVPAMWRAWHETNGIPPQTKLAISAGAPLPLNLEQAVMSKRGLKIHTFYGASECGGIAYDATETLRMDSSMIGSPMPNARVSLNEAGCLTVSGTIVGQTYWPQAEASLQDGVFQTTDLAEVRDGAIYLRGRASDQIHVAGRKVSPETIERALLAHPKVRECIVFGAPSPDEARTDLIVAMVAAEADEAALKQFLINQLPSWQVPRMWRFVAKLPVGPRGKLSRAECRTRFATQS